LDAEPRLTTEILNRFAAGDASLEDELVERIHGELRQIAAAQMARGGGGRTLQPTALVNEAWLRLAGAEEVEFEGRRQFYRFAGTLMRNLLIDRARSARSTRREAGLTLSAIDLAGSTGAHGPDGPDVVDALDLEDALARLEAREPELARVVELRLYCGLANAEVAGVLECSVRTVERRWRFARAWLVGELSAGEAGA
jgi:RNA polymerase sigma factor (TIGR02999 family)